jgi:hypothetical protein
VKGWFASLLQTLHARCELKGSKVLKDVYACITPLVDCACFVLIKLKKAQETWNRCTQQMIRKIARLSVRCLELSQGRHSGYASGWLPDFRIPSWPLQTIVQCRRSSSDGVSTSDDLMVCLHVHLRSVAYNWHVV